MTINVFGGGNSSAPVFPVQRSVRLRSSASAYFSKTWATSPTDGKKCTFNFWVKRGAFPASAPYVFHAGGGNRLGFYFDGTTNNAPVIQIGTTPSYVTCANSKRDPSAWDMYTIAVDTTQSTAANRVKIYFAGVEATYSSPTYPTQNSTVDFGANGVLNAIGALVNGTSNFDGYLAEFYFIDGQALTPTSFGSINSSTGVWQPIKYSGTYGTNGFYLNFQDNSAATAAAIGKDSSGNGNNWTPNNISVTAGVTYDSMLDVPTLTSGTNANFCVLNPLQRFDSSSVAGSYSSANLIVASGGIPTHAFGTLSIAAGDTTGWYWEGVCTSMDTSRTYVGICCPTDGPTSVGASYAFTTKFVISNTGQYWQASTNGASADGTLTSYAANDVIMLAYKNGSLWIGKNGVWMNSGDPVAGTGAVSTTLSTSKEWSVYFGYNSTWSTNFGQRPFTYTIPTGFKSLNTYNLPDSTIPSGATQFAATTYTGTGSSLAISNTVNGKSFQPDFVWVKGRSGATDHALYDSVRGTTKQLESNSTGAETTEATGLTAFDSSGFTVGALAQMNTNAATYVGWQWKAGGTAVTNTSGSISSQVSANPSAGFSVVTYTGTGVNGATVGHGLGVAPSMVFYKTRSNSNDGCVFHASLGGTQRLILFSTASGNLAAATDSTFFNNTAPSSTVLTLGTRSHVNDSSGTWTYVAYCFSAVPGYSKFGSYTGNGSTDGTFIYLGFRPRFILFKNTSAVSDWWIHDTSMSTYNVSSTPLFANLSNAQGNNAVYNIDILSSGFKLRTADTTVNGSGSNYIYACFAENPFKNALAR